MAERQGLCSLTLRIPLPLAAGALATDWQPDGLRPSAVFVSQRLASTLAAGNGGETGIVLAYAPHSLTARRGGTCNGLAA